MYAQNYGQQAQGYGQGPVGSVDNGDGTFTFQFGDGRPPFTAAGPVAQQYHSKFGAPTQPDQGIVDAAKPGTDQRTAMMGPMGAPSPSSEQQGQAMAGVRDAWNAFTTPLKDQNPERQGQSVPPESSPAMAKGAESQPGAAAGGAPANTAGMNADHVDPSQLSFGAGGTGGSGQLTYRQGTRGGWVQGAKEEKPGFQASSELYSARKGAQQAELGAVDKQAEAQRQATQLGVTLAANRADAIGLQVAQDQSRMTQQQDQVNAKLAELDRLGADVQAQKIDPRQLFHQVGALGEIGMAIAAGAGAFGQGLTGAPNTALEIINRKVDQNIGAQQANINNAKDAMAAKRQGIQLLRDSFATQNEQDAAHKVLVWKAVDSQLDAQKAKLGTAFDDAAYAQMKAGVQQKIADSQGGYEREAWTQTAIHSKYAPPQQGGFVQPAPGKFNHELYVPQFGGNAPTKEEAVKARAAGGMLQDIDAMVNENVALRNDPKSFIKGTDSYAKLKSNQAALSLRIKGPEGEALGVLAGPDMGLITDAIGDGTAITPGQTAAMQNYRANAHRRNAHVQQNLGIIPTQVSRYFNPRTGQVEMGEYPMGNPSSPIAAPNMTPRGE